MPMDPESQKFYEACKKELVEEGICSVIPQTDIFSATKAMIDHCKAIQHQFHQQGKDISPEQLIFVTISLAYAITPWAHHAIEW